MAWGLGGENGGGDSLYFFFSSTWTNLRESLHWHNSKNWLQSLAYWLPSLMGYDKR